MGFPEQISQYEKQQELMQLAQRSADNADWIGVLLAYSELDASHESSDHLVMVTEAKRLMGFIDVAGFPNSLSIEDVLSKLGITWGESLISKAVLFKQFLSDEDINAVRKLAPESRLLRQSWGTRSLCDSTLQFNSLPFLQKARVMSISSVNADRRNTCFEACDV